MYCGLKNKIVYNRVSNRFWAYAKSDYPTNSSNFDEIVHIDLVDWSCIRMCRETLTLGICNLKWTFHVESLTECTDSHVTSMPEEFWILAENFQSFDNDALKIQDDDQQSINESLLIGNPVQSNPSYSNLDTCCETEFNDAESTRWLLWMNFRLMMLTCMYFISGNNKSSTLQDHNRWSWPLLMSVIWRYNVW